VKAAIIGDSQAQGLLPVMGPILARRGYELDTDRSWAQQGAAIDAITEHARQVGPVDLAIVFSGGGNDPASLVNDQARYRDKLVTLVNTLRFAGVRQVIIVGPFSSDDPSVQALHDAARLVQARGIPGARWVDGEALTRWIPHPAGNLTHWDHASYQRIGVELERAIFEHGTVTAIGLVGTLAFLGAAGSVVMELLYARAAGDVS
jgi:hypothetical protein